MEPHYFLVEPDGLNFLFGNDGWSYRVQVCLYGYLIWHLCYSDSHHPFCVYIQSLPSFSSVSTFFFLFLNSSHPFGGVDHSSLNASSPLLVIFVIRNALLCLNFTIYDKKKNLHLFNPPIDRMGHRHNRRHSRLRPNRNCNIDTFNSTPIDSDPFSRSLAPTWH